MDTMMRDEIHLERVYATTFGAEAALVRPQIISGTHAISISLIWCVTSR